MYDPLTPTYQVYFLINMYKIHTPFDLWNIYDVIEVLKTLTSILTLNEPFLRQLHL